LKILILSSEVVPERAGGIATYTSTIAPALVARGHDVHVLSCAPEHSRRDDKVDGVWWHRRHLIGGERFPNLDRYRQSALRLATALSCLKALGSIGRRFDVIESPEWLAESLFVGAVARAPVVVNLHTPLRILFSFDVPRFDRDLRFADKLERVAAQRAAVVTTGAELLADELTHLGWLRSPPTIIRYPVDLDTGEDETPATETDANVLFVGRLEPRKAPETVVEAAAILAEDVPGLRVTLVGRSRGHRRGGQPYGEWLAERAEELRAPVRFVPQVPLAELKRFYTEARVVAVPSRFESFSLSALHAMAAERPVVCTSKVGAAELLRGRGTGREVPPDDAPALADALRPYLLDPDLAAREGRIGRDLVETECHPDLIAAQREACYIQAITRRRTP
jgi:glycosyltransferase involved in cell wall biosynthesis